MIPPPLHRQALRIAHELRKLWWRHAKPDVTGCRVLAFDEQDRLLLIRHSYGRQSWLPPGGGMNRGEQPLKGAAREFREELGCLLAAPFVVDIVDENLLGAHNIVHIVAGTVDGTPLPDGREVIACAFFAADELPQDMPMVLRGRMHEWVTAAIAVRRRDAVPVPALHPEQTG